VDCFALLAMTAGSLSLAMTAGSLSPAMTAGRFTGCQPIRLSRH